MSGTLEEHEIERGIQVALPALHLHHQVAVGAA